MKQSVLLQFQSLEELLRFKSEAMANCYEISPGKLLLTCDCTKEHIDLAKTKYRATLVEIKGKSRWV